MKEFRKNEQGFFICEECEKIYKTNNGFSQHINRCHNGQKEYYDKWIKENGEDLCKICGKITKFTGFRLNRGYEKCCCKEHLGTYLYKCRTEYNLMTYNVKNTYQRENIKEKIKQTKKDKYNNENYRNSVKAKQTNLKNHNGIHSSLIKECKEKSKQTCLKKYGVENPFQSEEKKEKCKQTCLKNHGVEHSFQSKEIQEKSKQTCKERYGVEYAMQNKEIFEKGQKNSFKAKKYKDTNIYYRGRNERDFLDKHYDLFPDMINALRIKYVFNEKEHYYFPDFYIQSLNLIVEIKSSWIITQQGIEQITAKAKATVANGFKYIMILDMNYEKFLSLYQVVYN